MNRGWTRDELLVAFNLYCRTPFGRLHQRNPDVIRLASAIRRTPGAVAMKLVNFAGLDPVHQHRNVVGLRHAGRGDREIFEEFSTNWEELALESEAALKRMSEYSPEPASDEAVFVAPQGPTERQQLTRVRTVQRFFRDTVLASYDGTCAMCGICIIELLTASHIIPWGTNVGRRVDPTNGIALCSLHDRAFDRGLVTISADFRIVIGKTLRVANPPEVHRVALTAMDGAPIRLPSRFRPDPDALRYHREYVFAGRSRERTEAQ